MTPAAVETQIAKLLMEARTGLYRRDLIDALSHITESRIANALTTMQQNDSIEATGSDGPKGRRRVITAKGRAMYSALYDELTATDASTNETDSATEQAAVQAQAEQEAATIGIENKELKIIALKRFGVYLETSLRKIFYDIADDLERLGDGPSTHHTTGDHHAE